MARRGNFLQTAIEDDPIVEAAPVVTPVAAPAEAQAAVPEAANDHVVDAPVAPEQAVSQAAADPASHPVSAVTPRRGSVLQTAVDDDPNEAVTEEKVEAAEAPAGCGVEAVASAPGADAQSADAEEQALNLATVAADALGLPPKVTAGGNAQSAPQGAVPGAAAHGPAFRPGSLGGSAPQTPPHPEPVDELHAEMMDLLRRPLAALMGTADARTADLAAQRQALAAERAALEATVAEKGKMEMQAAAAAAARRGNNGGSLLGGLGMAVAAVGQGIGSRIGRAGSVDTLDGVEARRLRDLTGKMTDIDAELASNRDFRGGLVAKNYAGTLKAADTFRRAQVKLAGKVEEFNARFEASAKGQAFLKNLDGLAAAKGIPAEEVRAHLHDLSNGEPAIERLRNMATALVKDPEFADDMQQMESLVGTMRRNGAALARGLSSAERNGLDLNELEGLDGILARMKMPDAKLARPGDEVPLDVLSEEQKKWNKAMMELVRALLDRLKSAFGFGGKAA